jgi:hypothetical protein
VSSAIIDDLQQTSPATIPTSLPCLQELRHLVWTQRTIPNPENARSVAGLGVGVREKRSGFTGRVLDAKRLDHDKDDIDITRRRFARDEASKDQEPSQAAGRPGEVVQKSKLDQGMTPGLAALAEHPRDFLPARLVDARRQLSGSIRRWKAQ